MNDEELIEELLKDPTVTFAEAVVMAAARKAAEASGRPATPQTPPAAAVGYTGSTPHAGIAEPRGAAVRRRAAVALAP